MDLIKKLEKRARELDQCIVQAGEYSLEVADDRELLEAAAKWISEAWYFYHDPRMSEL